MTDKPSYHDLIGDLERKYNNLISVADAMDFICNKLGCHQGIAAELILSHLPEEYDVMGKLANALFFGKRVGLSTFKYYENSPSIRRMLMRAIEKDITMLKKALTQEYKDFVFIKADLEECLGFTFDSPAEFRADLEYHSDNDQNKISEPLELFKVIQSLKKENEKLKRELAATKLKLPIFLGAYRIETTTLSCSPFSCVILNGAITMSTTDALFQHRLPWLPNFKKNMAKNRCLKCKQKP